MEFDTQNLGSYLTDHEKEAKEGVWKDYQGGIRIRILRAGGTNKKFHRLRNEALRPHQRQFVRGTIDPETVNQILLDVFSRSIVVDWQNVKDIEGNDVSCTPENVRSLFAAVPDLFDDVQEDANRMANFALERAEQAGETLGNSQPGR